MKGINLEKVEIGQGYFQQGIHNIEITEAYFYDREIFLAFFDRQKSKRLLQQFEIPQDIHLLKAIAIALELKDFKVFNSEVLLGRKLSANFDNASKKFRDFKKFLVLTPPPPPPPPEPVPEKKVIKTVKDLYGRRKEIFEEEPAKIVSTLKIDGTSQGMFI